MQTSYENLREVREKLLGYRMEAVARFSGITLARLRELEEGDEAPTVHETERLALLYGLDAEDLGELPIRVSPGDGIGVLALQPEFRDLDDETRRRIVAAANAAATLVRLRQREGDDPRKRFLSEVPAMIPSKKGVAWARGADHARCLRKRWRIGSAQIASMRDTLAERFPSITVLYARLGHEGPAGLAIADALRGPTIVVNLEGKNTNPLVRRFTLAHELCHLLVDFTRREPLATLSGYLGERALEVEQCANAFAVRLLCPDRQVQRVAKEHGAEVGARKLMETHGLPYSAVRLALMHAGFETLPPRPSDIGMMAAATADEWSRREEPQGLSRFPLSTVAPERRTHVARLAALQHAQGRLGRDAFAEALGVTPEAEVERVLAFFALDPPAALGP